MTHYFKKFSLPLCCSHICPSEWLQHSFGWMSVRRKHVPSQVLFKRIIVHLWKLDSKTQEMQAQRRGNASHGSCSWAAEIYGYTGLALRMAGNAGLEVPSSPTELMDA